ncbi:MAG: quinone-dependent dihydroorotate dehydrogenase [Thermoanaerobaculia bacterium]|nr:quinone-dependent dihydroorotate dehydrogenase [Thermoanaerobaculia bacterium]
MDWYSRLRPLFFCVPPEAAHGAGLKLLAWIGAKERRRERWRRRWPAVEDPVTLFGLPFPNRVGLAAGYDKDGVGWRGLETLGFGHLELGTVTPEAQPGNARPRVFRLSKDRGLINRLGFPSQGAAAMIDRLTRGRSPEAGSHRAILGINIGKQKETPLRDAARDYRLLTRMLAPHADYLAVNISSPNTPELRELQGATFLGRLVDEVLEERDGQIATLGRKLPVLVKISPDLDAAEIDRMVGTLVDAGVDGLIATNTTVGRRGLLSRHRDQGGGASGGPLRDLSLRVVEQIAERLAGRVPLVAVGGILDAADAADRITAGADLVQLYTGLIYRGPRLVQEAALAARSAFGAVDRTGFDSASGSVAKTPPQGESAAPVGSLARAEPASEFDNDRR